MSIDAGTATDSSTVRHAFDFDLAFRTLDRFLGITPDNTGVEIDGVDFVARFGPWSVTTPVSNLAGATVTGPFHVAKVVGPPHVSLRDRGLTFATNGRLGVCVKFHEPVTGLLPLGLIAHPALTVTVEHPAALAEFVNLVAANVPGTPRAGGDGDVVGAAAAELHDELRGMTASELRRRARELGIPTPAGLKKDELLELLLEVPQG